MAVRFWGVRGSLPMPGPDTVRYGGNTACVELRCGGSIHVLDAGTGIRGLGDSLMKEFRGRPIEARLFISHTHWDHLIGFPFFIPAYVPTTRLWIHGTRSLEKPFEEVFRSLMDPYHFPVSLGEMSPSIKFVETAGQALEHDGVRVTATSTNHPGMDLGYRFDYDGRCVVYLTDHESYVAMRGEDDYNQTQDRQIVDFCRGADLLIADAQYTDEEYATKKTWGHARVRDAIALAAAAGARRLALFHHDPARSDEALDALARDAASIARGLARELECFPAREGLELEIGC